MLQSLYTTAVANELIDARVQSAVRSSHTPLLRRMFSRGERAAAPRSAPNGRLRVSGAGR
jgi:hypothetical protein